MDAIASACVPVAIKELGNSVLIEPGYTPSHMINAAYEYVIAEHELPHADHSPESLRGDISDTEPDGYSSEDLSSSGKSTTPQ